MPELTRRDLLKMGAFGSAALLLPLERGLLAKGPDRMAESKLPRPFTIPFASPARLKPIRSDATTDYYSLAMRQASVEIIPGYKTTVWGYNGRVPGPLFDVPKGRRVVVRMANQLPAHPVLRYAPKTSVHLHGNASLPQYDGYASDVTPSGHYKDYVYPNDQYARTLWYHDHGVHQTGQNAYLGLAGMYRTSDPAERALRLPVGPYDVPLIVTDAFFTSSGQLLWDDKSESGLYGDVILVNGRPWPVMQVERRKYRFRILNASVSRSYRWQLDSGQPLTVIATDGGLTPVPEPVQQFRHSSGERYDVVVDFSQVPIGRRVVLRNLSNDNNVDFDHTDKVMAFDVVAEPTVTGNNSVPEQLNPNNSVMALDPATAKTERRFELEHTNSLWKINGKTWDDVIDSGFRHVEANPEVGDVEIWEFANTSGGWFHPTHTHLVDFKILSRNGQPPMPHERGPKDVVYVGENETVRVVARFGPHPGKYMIHCHNLVHEDHDMMTQFEVGSGGPDPITSAPAAKLPGPAL